MNVRLSLHAMAVGLALVICALSEKTSAQAVGDAFSGRIFHPLMAGEAQSPTVTKAAEDASVEIRRSLEGGAYCVAGSCIMAPPLPSGPANEVLDYVAEEKFGSYVSTMNKVGACSSEACAKQAVEQAVGLTKVAPATAQ